MELTRGFLPHFRANGGGGIININFGISSFTLPLGVVYCATKHALDAFTESLTYELSPQNIFIKSIVPFCTITSTKFSDTSNQLAAEKVDSSLLSVYGSFLQKIGGIYGNMTTWPGVLGDDVSQVVYTAATDGTDRLCYLLGPNQE